MMRATCGSRVLGRTAVTRCTVALRGRGPAMTTSLRSANVEAREVGTPGTPDYRVFFYNKEGKRISPWHDIALTEPGTRIEQGVLRYVVEIPKGTDQKMEIATDEPWNPIKQDTRKDGALRYLKHGPVLCNYGAFPQTWEDPSAEAHPQVNLAGDNDPIDVIEIGSRVAQRGEVVKVKVLGAFALVDEGELDWKVIAIDVNDPKAASLNDVGEVEKHMPGTLGAVQEWYRVYKVAEGKQKNAYAFDDKALDRAFTLSVLQHGHESWRKLFTARSSTKFAFDSAQ